MTAEDLKAFQSFVTKHNRNYLTKEEHNARLAIFKQNLDMVRAHDPVATGYKIGINKFSDLSLQEFEKMQGFREIKDLPAEVDKFLGDDDEDEETTMDEDCEEHCKAKGIECTHKKNEATTEEDPAGHGRGL